ncbi:MAG: dCTP deaminase [Planctomycetes bacterium]|jgi:dCTP deaminase|nr:dCTP deaminase [Planctomycetota bacterium]
MYLSDVDLRKAVESGDLIVSPVPKDEIGPTSIDLHLGPVDEAKVWDFAALAKHNEELGLRARELNVARMTYGTVSRKFLVQPPREANVGDGLVFRREDAIILRPYGFVVWQTEEIVGTPERDPKYICFIDGKSTRARTGLVVHLTAPTIHAGWSGNITLEMTNCGPLDLVLHAGDAIAQITVAQITQPPALNVRLYQAATYGQTSVCGADPDSASQSG